MTQEPGAARAEGADGVEVTVEDPVDPASIEVVVAGLVAYNTARVGVRPGWEGRPVAVVARRRGRIVGGADGMTGWGWLHVRFLWVTEAQRGAGIGRRIMDTIEAAARERGCRGAWLDTFSFQARPFYESIGYRQFGELADYPPGHSRHFMKKVFGEEDVTR